MRSSDFDTTGSIGDLAISFSNVADVAQLQRDEAVIQASVKRAKELEIQERLDNKLEIFHQLSSILLQSTRRSLFERLVQHKKPAIDTITRALIHLDARDICFRIQTSENPGIAKDISVIVWENENHFTMVDKRVVYKTREEVSTDVLIQTFGGTFFPAYKFDIAEDVIIKLAQIMAETLSPDNAHHIENALKTFSNLYEANDLPPHIRPTKEKKRREYFIYGAGRDGPY